MYIRSFILAPSPPPPRPSFSHFSVSLESLFVYNFLNLFIPVVVRSSNVNDAVVVGSAEVSNIQTEKKMCDNRG